MRKVPLRPQNVQDGSLLETENYNKNTVDQKNIFDIISFWSDKQYVNNKGCGSKSYNYYNFQTPAYLSHNGEK